MIPCILTNPTQQLQAPSHPLVPIAVQVVVVVESSTQDHLEEDQQQGYASPLSSEDPAVGLPQSVMSAEMLLIAGTRTCLVNQPEKFEISSDVYSVIGPKLPLKS